MRKLTLRELALIAGGDGTTTNTIAGPPDLGPPSPPESSSDPGAIGGPVSGSGGVIWQPPKRTDN